MTAMPPQTEFTASNGLKVATDVRGAVSVQWGSPRAGGWTSHDPEETLALQEFFHRHVAGTVHPGPFEIYAADDAGNPYIQLLYTGLEGSFAGEVHPDELDALIAQLIAVRVTVAEPTAAPELRSPT